MGIPTAFDAQLADVENAGTSILLCLRTMKHADVRDLPRMRAALRDRLREFVDLAMAAARDE
jgi:hypothetical protein